MESQAETKKPFPQYINPHPRRHFHWAIFLVLALGIAAGLLIFIQNFKTAEEIDSMVPVSLNNETKEDFSNWKIYRNEEYGFEFKYPRDWEVSESFSNQKGFFLSKGKASIAILPNGEFDYQGPLKAPIKTNIIFAGKNTAKREWKGWNEGFPEHRLIWYQITESIPNWRICLIDDLQNCNRIDVSTELKEDTILVDQILFTFRFIR